MPYLEEEYHRTDAALLRSSYEKMARHATLDKNYMLSILQRIRDYPIQIWDTFFCNCKIYNLMAPTAGQGEDLLFKNANVFSFNWIFIKKTMQDHTFFESSATFVDVKKSILFSANNEHALLFYNLIFDYAEIMRRQTLQKLAKANGSDQENELIIQRAYHKTRDDIQQWAFNSRYGTKLSALTVLNDLVKTELNKDNFAAYYRLQPDHVAI